MASRFTPLWAGDRLLPALGFSSEGTKIRWLLQSGRGQRARLGGNHRGQRDACTPPLAVPPSLPLFTADTHACHVFDSSLKVTKIPQVSAPCTGTETARGDPRCGVSLSPPSLPTLSSFHGFAPTPTPTP